MGACCLSPLVHPIVRPVLVSLFDLSLTHYLVPNLALVLIHLVLLLVLTLALVLALALVRLSVDRTPRRRSSTAGGCPHTPPSTDTRSTCSCASEKRGCCERGCDMKGCVVNDYVVSLCDLVGCKRRGVVT